MTAGPTLSDEPKGWTLVPAGGTPRRASTGMTTTLLAVAACSSNPAPDEGRPPPSTSAATPTSPSADPDAASTQPPPTADGRPSFGPIDRAARTATEDGIPILAIGKAKPA